jgi:hypothetical protein
VAQLRTEVLGARTADAHVFYSPPPSAPTPRPEGWPLVLSEPGIY